jgi:hypothetical protein
MRHIFTPDNPPPKSLAGQDLRDSYFGGTIDKVLDIQKINLAGADLTNVTFVFCNASNANLRGAKCYGVYCRHNTWTGAVLPEDTGFLQHEWVAEIIRQAAARLPAAASQKFLAVAGFVSESYAPTHSWNTSWDKGVSVENPQEMIPVWIATFAGYPRLTRRFQELVETYGARVATS